MQVLVQSVFGEIAAPLVPGVAMVALVIAFARYVANPPVVWRWREPDLETEYGDAADPGFLAELPLARADWVVSTVPIYPTGPSHEDTRAKLIGLTRNSPGLHGRIAVASHYPRDSKELLALGADLVPGPFQDVADSAVDILCGGAEEGRTEIPPIEMAEQQVQ